MNHAYSPPQLSRSAVVTRRSRLLGDSAGAGEFPVNAGSYALGVGYLNWERHRAWEHAY